MTRYLLDTGIMSLFINDRLGIRERIRKLRMGGSKVGTCQPVVAELYYGVEASATRDKNLILLERTLSSITVWPITDPVVKEYGRLSAELQKSGRKIQQFDRLIASIALSFGNCIVVSMDRDFLAIPNLKVEDWSITP